MAQRRERECVRRVVRKIEATLETELQVLGVGDPRGARAQQTVELRLRHGLGLELADADEVIELLRWHLHFRRARRAGRRAPGSGTGGSSACGGETRRSYT